MRVQVPFEKQVEAAGLPPAVEEYRFDPVRRWRLDRAWPERKVALEQEGGVWTQGRHTRGAGYVKDMEKYNRAAIAGWAVIRATPEQVENGDAIKLVVEAYKARDHSKALSGERLTKAF